MYGPDLKTVQEKQITIPLIIPWALQDYFMSTLTQEYKDVPSHFLGFPALIPVHDSTKYDPAVARLASLRDSPSERGNLRYCVITNESMWANEHRVLDEFAELMWTLSRWFDRCLRTSENYARANAHTDSESCLPALAQYLRERIVLPEIPDDQANQLTTRSGRLSLREALLFRRWAFDTPVVTLRHKSEGVAPWHPLFDEQAVLYPFPDELFWDPSDEGIRVETG